MLQHIRFIEAENKSIKTCFIFKFKTRFD